MWNQWFNPLFHLPVEPGYLSWRFAGRREDRGTRISDGQQPSTAGSTSASGKGWGTRSSDNACAQAAVSN